MATINVTSLQVAGVPGSLLTSSISDSVGVTDAVSTASAGGASVRITDLQMAGDGSTILTASISDTVGITDSTTATFGGVAILRVVELQLAAEVIPGVLLTATIADQISIEDMMFDQYQEVFETLSETVGITDIITWQKYTPGGHMYWTGTEWVGGTRRVWTGSVWKTL